MKSRIIILASVIVLGLTACGGNSFNNQDVHTHEDGTTHEGATHTEAPATHQQESFTVEPDSLANTAAHEHGHNHDHDHNHDHSTHQH